MSILAIITARKGSKGIPNKNFRKIGGLSLTGHAVKKAVELRERGLVEEVYLSSDSAYLCEQAAVMTGQKVPLRSEALSADHIKSIDVVKDVLEILQREGKTFTDVLILQPTSPLCSVDDYSRAIQLYKKAKAESLISVYRMEGVNPNGLYFVKDGIGAPVLTSHGSGTRRQELPAVYLRNGAVFLVSTAYMNRCGKLISDAPLCYEMAMEHSVNIDTWDDLAAAEAYWNRTHPTKLLRIPFSSENAACCTDACRRYRGMQVVCEELFYRAFAYCLSLCAGDPAAADEYLHRYLYINGTAIFSMGEDITQKVWNTELAPDRSQAMRCVMPMMQALLQGAATLLLEGPLCASSDAETILRFCMNENGQTIPGPSDTLY